MAAKTGQPQRRLTETLKRHKQQLANKKLAPLHTHHLREMSIAALLGVVVGVILSTVLIKFSFTNVTLAGMPVKNGTTQTQLEQQLAEKLEGYKVTLTYPDNTTKSFSLADMGVTVDTPQSVHDAIATQRPDNYIKRLKWWGKTEVPLVLHVDSAALESFVQNQGTQVTKPGKDAAVGVDQGNVIVTPSEVGEGYTLSGDTKAVTEAITKLQTRPLALTRQELPPAITDQKANEVAQKMRDIIAQPVSFSINGKQITAKPSDVGSWFDITPTPPNHTIDYAISSGKVLSYMNAIAKPYIQPPTTQIVLPGSGGDTVIIPGQNGVDITNKESTAAQVAQQLMDNKAVKIDLPVQFASYKTIDAQPHDKWIVVDTTAKRMYAYEGTSLIRTFLVSAGAPATPTVTGEFQIYSKYAVQDMRGANADGSRYFQPSVRWIMYFYRDYAIHGNYWRPLSYFGNVNSSHGCVGVTESDAKWLYDWAPIGTTVLVHR